MFAEHKPVGRQTDSVQIQSPILCGETNITEYQLCYLWQNKK